MDVTTVTGDASSLLTVRHVVVRGSDRQIGRDLATAARDAHGDGARPRRVDPDVERVRRRWFALHHPALAERSLGVADVFGIDPDDMTVALDALGTIARTPGCSVVFYPAAGTADGHPVLARNMDFPTCTLREFLGLAPLPGERAAVADPWIVEAYPDGGPASICIGFGDVMGGMDGVNAAGLAVALLADDVNASLEPNPTPQVGLSEGQVVRYLLDTCATAAEARDALRLAKHHYLHIPCHYVVTDAGGDGFVWEHSRHRNRELVVTAPGRDRVICTNHLLHRWPDATGLVDDDASASASRTYARWQSLDASTTGAGVVDRDDIDGHLRAVRFTGPGEGIRTIWHGAYDLADRAVDYQFFLGDDAPSTFTPPIRFALAPG